MDFQDCKSVSHEGKTKHIMFLAWAARSWGEACSTSVLVPERADPRGTWVLYGFVAKDFEKSSKKMEKHQEPQSDQSLTTSLLIWCIFGGWQGYPPQQGLPTLALMLLHAFLGCWFSKGPGLSTSFCRVIGKVWFFVETFFGRYDGPGRTGCDWTTLNQEKTLENHCQPRSSQSQWYRIDQDI